MKCLPILVGFCFAVAVTGCSTRVEVEHEEAAQSSAERYTTICEVAPLGSSPPVPAEPSSDPQPPFIDLDGTGNVIVLGDVEEHHHHLHIHEAPKPPRVRVDVHVHLDAIDARDRRRRLAVQWLTELLDRR